MSDLLCPEDAVYLVEVPLERAGGTVHECPDCQGVWVDRELIERLAESVEPDPPPSAAGPTAEIRGMDPTPPRFFRACAVCAALMDWRACGGVVVDVCSEHGVWFDDGKLEPFVAWVQAGQPRSGSHLETMPLAAFLGLAAPMSASGEGAFERAAASPATEVAAGALDVLTAVVEILAK
ncbi:MAG: zf-TFIIB domain-containing protein [Acidobacteriota bacterium]